MPQRKSDSTAPSSVEDRQQSPLNPLLQHHRIISNNHIFFHQAPPSLLTASEPSTPASWSPAGSRASTPIPYSFGRPPPTSSSIGGLRLPDFAAIPGFSASLAAFAAASSASPAPSTTPSSPLVSGIPGYFPPFSSSSSAAAAAGVLPYPTPTTETSGPPSWFTSGPTVMPAMFAAAVPSPILAGLPMPKDGGGMSLPPTPMTASLPTTTTTAVDAAAMHAHLAYNMLMASSTTSVAAVTAPPVPLGLSLRIGGVPAVGAKSRVETQIKFVVELVSATTGEKAVGMYQQLRLPDLLIANDRWKRAGDMRGSSSSSTAAAADTSSAPGTPAPSDSAPGSPMRCPTGSDNDTVWLHARVVRGSNSSEEVRVCDVCVLREQRKRSGRRKTAAKGTTALPSPPESVPGSPTPPSVSDTTGSRPTSRGRAAAAAAAAVAATATATPAGDLAMSDRKTMLVHAPPVMDFAQGDATLPTRIPCYSRHHKEKVGFVVEFELRDVHGRAIARGESPPILITDDHKMTKKSIAAKAAAAGEAADVAPSVQTKAPGAAAKTARGTKRSRSGEPIEAVAPVDSAEPSPVTSTVTLPSTSASPPATAAVAHDQPPAMTSMQSAWTMLGLPALPPPIGSSAADLSRRASDSSFSSNGEMTAPQPPADMLRSVMYLPGVPMGSPGAGSAAVSLTGTWATSVDAPPLRASQAPASVAPLRLEDMLRSPALHDAEDHHPQLLQQQPPPTPITPHDTASQSWMNIDTLLFGGSLSAPPSDEGISTSAGETDDDQSPRPKRQRGQHGQVVVPVSPESTGSSSQHDMDLFDASLFHFVPTASAPMVMPSSCRQSPTSEEVHPQPTTVSPQMLLNLPHQGLAQQLQAHEMATPFLPPPAMPPFYSTSHTSPGHMPLGALGHPVAAPNMSASSLFASSTGPNAQPIPLAQFLQAAAALSGQAVSLPTSLAPAALASSVSQQQQHMPLMMAHQQQQLQMQHQLQLQQYQGRAGSSWLPKVDRIVPAEGPLQGGTEVTVLGSGFNDSISIQFGDTAAHTVYWSATTLVCTVPPGARPGPVLVRVKEVVELGISDAVAGQHNVVFTYLAGQSDRLLELALTLLSYNMGGNGTSAAPPGSGGGNGMIGQHPSSSSAWPSHGGSVGGMGQYAQHIVGQHWSLSSSHAQESESLESVTHLLTDLSASSSTTAISTGEQVALRAIQRFAATSSTKRHQKSLAHILDSHRSSTGAALVHLAAENKYSQLLQWLVRVAGADVGVRDGRGRSVEEVARAVGWDEGVAVARAAVVSEITPLVVSAPVPSTTATKKAKSIEPSCDITSPSSGKASSASSSASTTTATSSTSSSVASLTGWHLHSRMSAVLRAPATTALLRGILAAFVAMAVAVQIQQAIQYKGDVWVAKAARWSAAGVNDVLTWLDEVPLSSSSSLADGDLLPLQKQEEQLITKKPRGGWQAAVDAMWAAHPPPSSSANTGSSIGTGDESEGDLWEMGRSSSTSTSTASWRMAVS